MTSPIPLYAWLRQLNAAEGTVVEASNDQAEPVICTKVGGDAWRIEPASPPTFDGSSIDRWVQFSSNAVVQEEWEKLKECLRMVHDLLPPHDAMDPYASPSEYRIDGDDLGALLLNADTAFTLADSHRFIAGRTGGRLCGECHKEEGSPAHQDADKMMRNGLL